MHRPPSAAPAARRAAHARRMANDPLNQLRCLLYAAKHRAKVKGVVFALTIDNVPPFPSHCPALGIPLTRAGGKNSPNMPELDRLVPALGYTPENIRWISKRANMIKQDATPEEIHAVYTWLREQLPTSRPL